ncbi:unnamed protein product [Didymodactylos carnosus]|uniref:Uncharacterized protein n=1 Tax=Didymodactylos carnosus TaxID=1234261 RepID=A0A815KH54_9BILA|nr:unnamed protein product [Didymodactylos carnosus]CAF4290357.1 unnamed protein product [Didymodactylos carnosus]
MKSYLRSTMTSEKTSAVPRIVQTKEAIKQLLKEIAESAGPSDQAVLTTFDEKLIQPSLIPSCKAFEIADESNLARIDRIELSARSTNTHLYSALKEVYHFLEQQPFLYIDIYVFSDGLDTSSRKNDQAYQAIIHNLNEKLGVKCHFINYGSSDGFSLADWLGEPEADCPISGSIDEIRAQMTSSYQKHHTRNPIMIKMSSRSPEDKLSNIPRNLSAAGEYSSTRSDLPRFGRNVQNEDCIPRLHPVQIDDYLCNLPSANPSRSSSFIGNGLRPPEISVIATLPPGVRKPKRN